MGLRPLNDDKITVSQYRFKKQIEELQSECESLEYELNEKSGVCKELISENKKLTTVVKNLKKKLKEK